MTSGVKLSRAIERAAEIIEEQSGHFELRRAGGRKGGRGRGSCAGRCDVAGGCGEHYAVPPPHRPRGTSTRMHRLDHAPLVPAAGPFAGRYVIERELGGGGMATVLLAEEQKHHRKVAIKILRP